MQPPMKHSLSARDMALTSSTWSMTKASPLLGLLQVMFSVWRQVVLHGGKVLMPNASSASLMICFSLALQQEVVLLHVHHQTRRSVSRKSLLKGVVTHFSGLVWLNATLIDLSPLTKLGIIAKLGRVCSQSPKASWHQQMVVRRKIFSCGNHPIWCSNTLLHTANSHRCHNVLMSALNYIAQCLEKTPSTLGGWYCDMHDQLHKSTNLAGVIRDMLWLQKKLVQWDSDQASRVEGRSICILEQKVRLGSWYTNPHMSFIFDKATNLLCVMYAAVVKDENALGPRIRICERNLQATKEYQSENHHRTPLNFIPQVHARM